jgi:predicted acylesterase/phospholipase RssA
VTPLAITAVDLAANERVVLREGRISAAVLASMMVPTILPPRLVSGRWLSDPGVIDSVPIDVAGDFGVATVVAVSADMTPETADRWVVAHASVSASFRCAARLCSAVSTRMLWPRVAQFGWTLGRIGQGKAQYASPPNVIWIQPAFGRMTANDFGAWDRAVALGEEAIRNASPLLQAALEGGGIAPSVGPSGEPLLRDGAAIHA